MFRAQDNTGISQNFAYLCSNGTLQSFVDNPNPCTWLRQPWKLIISRSEPAIQMSQSINRWMRSSGTWEVALRDIIQADNFAINDVTNIQLVRDYFRPCKCGVNLL